MATKRKRRTPSKRKKTAAKRRTPKPAKASSTPNALRRTWDAAQRHENALIDRLPDRASGKQLEAAWKAAAATNAARLRYLRARGAKRR